MFYLIFIVIILLFIVFLFKFILIKRNYKNLDFPYDKKTPLFSAAERSFLGVLDQAVNGKFIIMGKVRLADILKVKSGLNGSERQKAFNRIQNKHLDFVACDPQSLDIKFAVELDDKSHNQLNRKDRDDFIDKALSAAGIPILHITAKQSYSMQDIQGLISGIKF